MDSIAFSILLVLIGLFVGIILMFIINYIKGSKAEKKAELLLEKAKKKQIKLNVIIY